MTDTPKPASFLDNESSGFRYTEKTNPDTSNLDFLTYGIYEISGDTPSGVQGFHQRVLRDQQPYPEADY